MKRNTGILFFILAVVLLVTGCFSKNNGNTKKSKEKDPIVFNLGSDYKTLDPHLFSEMIGAQVDSSIFEGLLRLDENGNYTGGVAESFKEDGNKLTFKIRENAKWSDGSKITANDFLFAFKRVLNPKTAAQFAEMLFPIKNAEAYYEGKVQENEFGVRVIDEGTLEITLEYPVSYFKYILTLPVTAPLKEEFYNIHKDKYAIKQDSFLFNGPYKIVSLKENEILLEKNEYYWNSKNIKIPEIKYVISKDFKVVDDLIKNKEIDMSRVENYHLEKYKKEGTVDTFLNGRVWYLDFNLNNKYLQNKKLRKAILLVIDREKYVKEIKKDGSVVAKSLISSIISGHSKKYREKYPDTDNFKDNDIEEAKKLYSEALKELGISTLKLNLLSGNSDPEKLEIQFLQEELKTKLGLETNVTVVPFKERLNRTRTGDYDIVLNTWSPKFDDALSYLERWKKNDGKNESIWSKKQYNLLVEEISKMSSGDERDKKTNEAEMILVNEAVIVPLYFSVENHYINPSIKGIVRRSITGIADFNYGYIEK